MKITHIIPSITLALSLCVPLAAHAGAIQSGFNANTLAANDDGSTGLVNLGFTANFFGTSVTQAYVNNNGNITFDSSLSTFTPFDLTSTGQQIIAPFFADVDTSSAGSPVTYGTGTFAGRNAFGVNWVDVDYYNSSTSHTNRNSFQLILADRSDIGAGDFDIIFNYDQIQWETGTASSSGGNANGLGGNSARAGFSNGTGTSGSFFELTGSAINGALLDGGTNALISNSLNSNVAGQYIFQARNGQVNQGGGNNVPEPGTLALMSISMIGFGVSRRRKNK